MKKAAPRDDWTCLEGLITAAGIRCLGSEGAIARLSLTRMPTLTARIAQGFSALQSVDWLWLWCDVTRTAMRHVIGIPGLRSLDILKIVGPGRLQPLSAATGLESLRSSHCLTEADLLQVSTCSSLRELGAQGARLTPRVIEALLGMPHLTSLDLESSPFNDAMAARLSVSTRLTALDLGATRITRTGLAQLCRMQQLRALDLWATPIREQDLDLLAELPALEYLSVGEVSDRPSFDANTLLPRLAALPALRRIWLDGVRLDAAQRASLGARYEVIRITNSGEE